MTKAVPTIKSVTFFGCACGEQGDPHYDAAYDVAKLVAESGRKVVNGGGPGVMLAATTGAQEGKGKTAVVYYRPKQATMFMSEVAANYADQHYEEENYVKRTKKLLELGDAYIVFNGGTGTISEFAMAWGLARLYFGHHKPLILYGEFWHHIMNEIKAHMLVRKEEYEVFTIATTPEEALKAIEDYEKIIREHGHPKVTGAERFFVL